MKFKKYITADPKPVKQGKNSIKQPAVKRMNWEKKYLYIISVISK
jgi:hypothetical protein